MNIKLSTCLPINSNLTPCISISIRINKSMKMNPILTISKTNNSIICYCKIFTEKWSSITISISYSETSPFIKYNNTISISTIGISFSLYTSTPKITRIPSNLIPCLSVWCNQKIILFHIPVTSY